MTSTGWRVTTCWKQEISLLAVTSVLDLGCGSRNRSADDFGHVSWQESILSFKGLMCQNQGRKAVLYLHDK